MSRARMPLCTTTYLRETRHLTPEEHGIYLLLLMHCWEQQGPVPLDERHQAGIVNARSGGEIESLRRVLEEFFTRMDDGWYHERLARELEHARQVSARRAAAGRAGQQARRAKRPSKRSAPAEQLLSKCSANAAVPYQEIISLYHEILPMLPKVFDLSPARKAQIRARWTEGSLPDLDAWRHYFGLVAKSPFLTGRVDPRPGRKPFRADLEWITKQANFLKIAEGRYA